jgi:hypothetical protein
MTHLFESGKFDKPIIEPIVFIIFENITLLIKVHTNLTTYSIFQDDQIQIKI